MQMKPFAEMSMSQGETGVLWAINRYLFHPRGYALAIHYDDDSNATGWSLMGDGTECWSMGADFDDEGFAAFEAFLRSLSPVEA